MKQQPHWNLLRRRSVLATLCLGIGWASLCLQRVRADDLADTVRLATQYLASDDIAERGALEKELIDARPSWQAVLTALKERAVGRSGFDVEPGYYAKQRFSLAELAAKHPDDLLYFIVPRSYRPDRPSGLIVFMHGGGRSSPRTSPARYLRRAKPTEAYIGDIFEQTGMIGVAPSAPWNPNNHSRWTLPEADEFLADVIAECQSRFRIDPNRVILWGHSMGGFGAYQQVQRQPDRFAAVIASAGSWTLAQWPVIRGTTFCIVHGTRDAERGVRDRHTDIQFARMAHRRLDELGIPHIYQEHGGPHPVAHAKKPVLEFLLRHPELRRNPFPRQVAVASPVGFRTNCCYPKRHSFWVTLDRSLPQGELEYDALVVPHKGHRNTSSQADWDSWKLTMTTQRRPGAMVEAVNRGNNEFEVTTRGVSRLTLWLHPRMADLEKPIRVTLNGNQRIERLVKPTVVTLLESYARRHDWELVYPAKLAIDVRPGSQPLP